MAPQLVKDGTIQAPQLTLVLVQELLAAEQEHNTSSQTGAPTHLELTMPKATPK
jgi:hypothetical protein